ncbi:hypothetical protein Y032_0384g415 [Ancylostoma ceylanicum]|uniref:Uncharacterized protein n=1 Tax=Ancylostoma ceylanicum TaxID=53326 RepID=A0A016RTM3_9BILA|nr:hypothetical protein Y032_0384g415 [Ancylostoma ceylanicum]
MYSELQTAVDKGRDRSAASLGSDTGTLHADSGSSLLSAVENSSATPQQTTRAGMQSSCVSAEELRAAVLPFCYGRLEFTVITQRVSPVQRTKQ